MTSTAPAIPPPEGREYHPPDGRQRPSIPIPKYLALPHAALDLEPAALAVYAGLLADRLDRGIPVLRILASGGRPYVAGATADVCRAIGAHCGLGERVVRRELATLERAGLITSSEKKRRIRIELRASAWGWPDEDLERQRAGRAKRLARRYVPLPVAPLETSSPAEIAVLAHVLAAVGVGVYDRLAAGERVAVRVTEREIATKARVTDRTVRRALAKLESDNVIRRTPLGRGGIAIELTLGGRDQDQHAGCPPGETRTSTAATDEKADICGESLTCARTDSPETEGLGETEGARERAAARSVRLSAAAIYGALLAAVLCGVRVTTGGQRARLRRAALTCALGGATPELVAAIGAQTGRERGEPPSPELVAARVLERLALERLRGAERRRAAPPPECRPAPAQHCEHCRADDAASVLLADGEPFPCPHNLEAITSRAEGIARSRGTTLRRVTTRDGRVLVDRPGPPCPLCAGTDRLEFTVNGRPSSTRCPHDRERAAEWARQYGWRVEGLERRPAAV